MPTLQSDCFTAYDNLKLTRDDKGVLVAEFLAEPDKKMSGLKRWHRVGEVCRSGTAMPTGSRRHLR